MTGKHFTEDFRNEAVRLPLITGFSRHQIADDLGTGHSTLASGYQLIVLKRAAVLMVGRAWSKNCVSLAS